MPTGEHRHSRYCKNGVGQLMGGANRTVRVARAVRVDGGYVGMQCAIEHDFACGADDGNHSRDSAGCDVPLVAAIGWTISPLLVSSCCGGARASCVL